MSLDRFINVALQSPNKHFGEGENYGNHASYTINALFHAKMEIIYKPVKVGEGREGLKYIHHCKYHNLMKYIKSARVSSQMK